MTTIKNNFECDVVAPQKQIRKIVGDLSYLRRHPFYAEWRDWKDIVLRYHSDRTVLIQQAINKGHRIWNNLDLTQRESWLVDEVYFQSMRISRMLEMCEDKEDVKLLLSNSFESEQFAMLHSGLCDCEDYVAGDRWIFPKIHCEMAIYHKRAHVLAHLWAYSENSKSRRHVRKYYRRLERIILSLNEQQLNCFDVDLILDPIMYKGHNLLKHLYATAMLDKVSVDDFVRRAEYLKHFIAKEQSGAYQSQSASLYDEMIKIGQRLFRVDDSVVDHVLLPQEQGLFTINHTWDDKDLDRFRDILEQARSNFFSSLEDTIVLTAKYAVLMFAITSIAALLSRIVVGVTFKVVYGLIQLVCGFICGTEVQSDIRYVREQSGKTDEQSKDEEEKEIESLPFLPRIIIRYLIDPPKDLLSNIWCSRHTDLVMRRISYLGDNKIEKGLDRVISWLKRVIKDTIHWYFKDRFDAYLPEWLLGEKDAVCAWIDKIREQVLEPNMKGTFVWSDASWSFVYNLYTEGLQLSRSALFADRKRDMWSTVVQLGNILEKFKIKNKDGASIRNPPVTIYLYGDTGVGKSALAYPLAVSMLGKIFKRENNPIDLESNWKNLIYLRAAEQEYWDGYCNQLVTLFDDFNQQVDSASNPSIELFEIIRASNCFPYPLHMAALEDKSTTSFTSKIVILSSNKVKPKTESLNYPAALERRFDICVRVSRKSEFKKMPDDAKFNKDIYRFDLYDMPTGNTLVTGLTYDELVTKGVDKYFGRRNFVDSINDTILDLIRSEKNAEEQGGGYSEGPYDFEYRKPVEWDVHDRPIVNIPLNPNDCNMSYYDWFKATRETLAFKEARESLVEIMWDGLQEAVDRMRAKYKYYQDKFIDFKNRNSFIDKMKLPLALLMGGMAFIGLFAGITALVRGRKKESFPFVGETHAKMRIASNESYVPKAHVAAKIEGYNPTIVKVAKLEGYVPPQVKMARVESIDDFVDLSQDKSARRLAIQEGVKDLSAAEILLKTVRSNLYKMFESTCGNAIGHILFLRGRIAVMPKHYRYALDQSLKNDPEAVISFQSVALDRCFNIKLKDMINNIKSFESPDENGGPVCSRDLMSVYIPTAITHADSVPTFCHKESLSYVDQTEVMLPVLMQNNQSKKGALIVKYTEGNTKLKVVEELSVTGAGDRSNIVKRYIRDAWEYHLDTQATECGAPLIIRNTRINPGKICGLHIAGIDGTGQGFSTPLYREDVERILDEWPAEYKSVKVYEYPLLEYATEQSRLPEEAEFVRLGQLSKPIFEFAKTAIEPSLVYDKIRTPVTKPCLLRPKVVNNELFDPKVYRLNRLGNVPVAIDEDLIKNSKEALIDEISGTIDKSQINSNIKAVYSFDETVKGIDGEMFINSVKRDTSPGFPYVQQGKVRKDFFGSKEIYSLDSADAQALRERVKFIIDSAKKNISLDHYFIDTLKDERKPLHKAHKTRLFAAGPLDYLITCKMYFNGIVALLTQFRNADHISVGTNPYSQDWDEIARLLSRKSSDMIAGDFEGFDASQHQRLLEAAGEVLIELSKRFCGSSEEDCLVMRVLLISLFNSLHIVGGDVYQWTHSLPSGHYLTAIINSIFVNLAFGIVWQLCFQDKTYLGTREFWSQCGIVAYGDDHVVSVPKSRSEVFNQFTLPHLFKLIGLSYTMEDKDAIAQEKTRPLSEVSYLKRKFALDKTGGKWLAPLSLDTILETPMWMKKCPDPVKQTLANLEWSLKELSLHPEEIWNEWAPKLRNLEVSLGFYTKLIDQKSCRLVCMSENFEV